LWRQCFPDGVSANKTQRAGFLKLSTQSTNPVFQWSLGFVGKKVREIAADGDCQPWPLF
jgi:hypothetical protein